MRVSKVQMMKAMLAVWNDVDETVLDEYEAWYQTEHLPERLAFNGFEAAIRTESVPNAGGVYPSPRFMTFYELASIEVLEQASYRRALQSPTPRTQAIMPYFRNMWRAAAVLRATSGLACSGAWTVSIRIESERLQFWIDQLLERPPERACRWRAYQCPQPGDPLQASPEARFRASPDQTPGAFLLIEHLRQPDADQTLREWVGPRVEASNPMRRDPVTTKVDLFVELARLDSRNLGIR
ncbi:MAG: hypothetical protein EBQ78_12080 [Betaproteobacteria bacterium]|jgi:hypothetical protein|nr:hypothetical protein [Betaproteobacteria bacterium]NBY18285.1 hypothetical protein [Betaproteobacteria bacterium]